MTTQVNSILCFLRKNLFRKRVLALITTILLIFFIFLRIDSALFIDTLQHANLFFILALYPFIGISIILKSYKLRQILNFFGVSISIPELSKLYLIGFFLGILTPGRIGDFSKAFYLRSKMPLALGLTAIFLDRLLDVCILIFFALLAMVGFQYLLGIVLISFELAFLLSVFFLLLIFVFFNLGFVEPLLKISFRYFAPKRYSLLLSRSYRTIRNSLEELKKKKIRLLAAILLGYAVWIINFSFSYLILSALSIQIPVILLLVLVPMISLVELIPVSISALGTRDLTVIALFSAVGIPAEKALAFSITYFITIYLAVGLFGFYTFLKNPLPAELE